MVKFYTRLVVVISQLYLLSASPFPHLHTHTHTPSLPPFYQVTTEEAQAYADRHNMISYVELSAKDIKYLPVLDDTLVILARQMLRIREELEKTQSAAFADEIIRLKSTSEEWEILSAPSEPVPDYVYKAQEKRIETPKCRC